MTPLKSQPDRGLSLRPRSLLFALAPTLLLLLTLLALATDVAAGSLAVLCALTVTAIAGALLRLDRIVQASEHARSLSIARIHLLLHSVPMAWAVSQLAGVHTSATDLLWALLFTLFFLTGRATWKRLAALFPATLIYRLFHRGNSAFLTSLPILYLAGLALPETVNPLWMHRVATFYFSIHFMILGVSCLKIAADLGPTDASAGDTPQ